MSYLRKAQAFIKRDFIIESSYKLAFILLLANSMVTLVAFFFTGKLVNGSHAYAIQRYSDSYFPFALIGINFSTYFMMAINTFSTTMRRAQMAGCLEAILSSQTSARTVVFMSSLYSFISAGVQLVAGFVFAVIVLRFDFTNINVTGTLIVFLVSQIIFMSLGIFSAAGTILFKQGEPFAGIFGGVSMVLGGAYFPLDLMPGWLTTIARLFPLSYSLDALRLTMLRHYGPDQVARQLLILSSFAVVLLPFSLWFFNWTVEKGKRDGTLMQY